MDTLRIEMLGGLGAYRAGREVHRFQTSKAGALLAYLAYHPRQEHARDSMVDRLWGDADYDSGRHCLRQALTSLRHLLELDDPAAATVIRATRTTVSLDPSLISTDVLDFAAAVRAAERTPDGSERVRMLLKAIDLYKGDLLPGYFDDWILVERDRLMSAYAHILRLAVSGMEKLGDTECALEYALRAVRAAPLREEVHHDLIRLYIAAGKLDDAVRQFRQLARILKREQGRVPAAATRSLIAPLKVRLRKRRAERGERDEADSPAWTGAGAHQPSRAPRAEPRPAPKLPRKLTRFFGRESEIAQLTAMLRPAGGPETARLVTLLGSGGAGKTRLAVEVATALAPSYGNSVYFVDLSEVSSADAIADAIAGQALTPCPPATEPEAHVVGALAGRSVLLVMDNFEHLVGGGEAAVCRLLDCLPELTCMVTSRQALSVEGEQEFPVHPLAVPTRPGTPDRLLEFASVRLFVDRAQAVCPEFQITQRNVAAVAAVCQHLEGIPLAIELAAGRAQALTPLQMLTQLASRFDFLVSRKRNVQDRHRTLREAIDWSFHLLTPELRRFFVQLSVFRGGWNLEAAERICGLESESPVPGVFGIALEWTEQLLERSLIAAEDRGDEKRYRMLETLREYAAEKLDAHERRTVAERHAIFFLDLTEAAAPHLRGPQAGAWLERLDADHDNLRAALEWLPSGEARLRFVDAAWRFWFLRGHAAEGRKAIESALEQSGGAPIVLVARALNALGVLADHLGDLDRSSAALNRAVSLFRGLHDSGGVAEALCNLAVLEDERGDSAVASRLCEESLSLRRQLGDRLAIAASLNNYGGVLRNLGDPAAAMNAFRESHQIFEELGDDADAAAALANVGTTALGLGDYGAARAAFERSAEVFRSLGNRWGEVVALNNLGDALIRMGDDRAARPLYLRCLLVRRELNDRAGAAISLAGLASAALAAGDTRKAVRLFAASESAHETLGSTVPTAERDLHSAQIAAARRASGAADFAADWEYGRSLRLDQAIAYALEVDADALPVDTVALPVV